MQVHQLPAATDGRDAAIRELKAALASAQAERDAALWALRIVRRDIQWYDDSPTLRVVDKVLANGAAPANVPVLAPFVRPGRDRKSREP